MNKESKALKYANRLEGILKLYLGCKYNEFGVKANGNLLREDWSSPINFALGYKYGFSKNDNLKEIIDSFLGNDLFGKNIEDIIENYEYYAFDTKDDAYNYIEKTIKSLEKILKLKL